ncbi:MAG: PTS IIA-like nitrogen-regulatory protein PtsN [Gammaproteobacteria bacterium RIFCSPLOWO2_02_FULL_57_10]|nr:MAG: PTS IIA-like nitrogen-regulatory protein PtsN [Gammaproteobacteria bacterium RIFCSPLOWO2_02_FULL_57_10]
MRLETILTPERCFCNLPGVSKKRFLTTVSELISEATHSLSADQIYTALLAREQLGSTGIGNGIAIPHCRVADCKTITGTLVTLEEGIDFDAIDSRTVDLLFVLIVPAEEMNEHLKVLGAVASLFHQEEFCNKLRQARSAQELYDIATSF